jgi:hypothetical protein
MLAALNELMPEYQENPKVIQKGQKKNHEWFQKSLHIS